MAGRPPKDAAERKVDPLRIPMTAAQKQAIREAAGDEDMAAWARTVLLAAAESKKSGRKR